MSFNQLMIESWKQFERIKINFDPSLTILTGGNGSGKTTLLSILSSHFGWSRIELATPIKEKETGLIQFISRLFLGKKIANNKIGEIHYKNGMSDLIIPNGNNLQYHVEIPGMQGLLGLNIPSHRSVYFYQQVPHISTQKRSKQEAYNLVQQSSIAKYQNSHSNSSNYFIKETLLNWAIGGSGNQFIEADKELIENYKGFENVLQMVLPDTLGFRRLSIRSYEIVLETNSGDFLIDSVSGGVSAIIDLVWQIYNCSKNPDGGAVILIDEIENHLHPSMQRRILGDLINAFPKCQFVVSTHSPLIVGSVKESKVYALRYNENTRVVSEELDLVNKAKTANQVLNDVLGVPVTMPIWAESDLARIVDRYLSKGNDNIVLGEMKEELDKNGLSDYLPEVLVNFLGKSL